MITEKGTVFIDLDGGRYYTEGTEVYVEPKTEIVPLPNTKELAVDSHFLGIEVNVDPVFLYVDNVYPNILPPYRIIKHFSSQALDATITTLDNHLLEYDTYKTDTGATLNALATADTDLSTRITANADGITVNAGKITVLQADLDNVTAGSNANALAIDSLEVEVSDINGTLSAQATSITNLESRVTDVENGQAGNATAITELKTRVTSNEDGITATSSLITELETDVYNLETEQSAQATAISTLQTDVVSNENGITANAVSITDLEVVVYDANTGVSANATAIDSLETTVSIHGDDIIANASSVTSIESTISSDLRVIIKSATEPTTRDDASALKDGDIWIDTDDDNAAYIYDLATTSWEPYDGKVKLDVIANASAITSLETTVTQHGDDITANATAITALESTVNDPNTGVNANASAINTLETNVSTIDGEVTANATAITAINSELTNDLKTVIRSATEPTERVSTDPLVDGDIWIDSDDGDTAYVWDSGTLTWLPYDGKLKDQYSATADATFTLETQVQGDENNVGLIDSVAELQVSVTSIEDNPPGTLIFRQDTAPADRGTDSDGATLPLVIGDLWINTSIVNLDELGEISSWDGTAWIESEKDFKAGFAGIQTRVTSVEDNLEATAVLYVKADSSIGAIDLKANADTGSVINIQSDLLNIDALTTFAANYDPSTKETPTGAQTKADTAEGNANTYTDQELAAGLTTVGAIIRSDTEPIQRVNGTALQVGDVWIETDDGDAPWTYNGTSFIRSFTRIDGGFIQTGVVDAQRLDVVGIFAQDAAIAGTLTLGDPVTVNIATNANAPAINQYGATYSPTDISISLGGSTAKATETTPYIATEKENITVVTFYDFSLDQAGTTDGWYGIRRVAIALMGKVGTNDPKVITENIYTAGGPSLFFDEYLIGNTFDFDNVGIRVIIERDSTTTSTADLTISDITITQQSSSIALSSDGLYQRISATKVVPYGSGGSGSALTVEGSNIIDWTAIANNPFEAYVPSDFAELGDSVNFHNLTLTGALDGVGATFSSKVTANNFRTGTSTNYSHIIRSGSGAALYINQVGTGPIARFSSGTDGANDGVVFSIENDGAVQVAGSTVIDASQNAYFNKILLSGVLYYLAANGAHVQADARGEGSTLATLHKYGKNPSDVNTRWAENWYDGSSYHNAYASSVGFHFNTGLNTDGRIRINLGNDDSATIIDGRSSEAMGVANIGREDLILLGRTFDSPNRDLGFGYKAEGDFGTDPVFFSNKPIRTDSGYKIGANEVIDSSRAAFFRINVTVTREDSGVVQYTLEDVDNSWFVRYRGDVNEFVLRTGTNNVVRVDDAASDSSLHILSDSRTSVKQLAISGSTVIDTGQNAFFNEGDFTGEVNIGVNTTYSDSLLKIRNDDGTVLTSTSITAGNHTAGILIDNLSTVDNQGSPITWRGRGTGTAFAAIAGTFPSADYSILRFYTEASNTFAERFNIGSSVNILVDSIFDTQASTASFTSGFAGDGTQIDFDGSHIESNTLTVRGRMDIYELEVNKVRASNGSIFASSGQKIDSVIVLGAPYRYRCFVPESQFVRFQEGDIIYAQRFDGGSTYEVYYEVYNVENGSATETDNTTARYFDVITIDRDNKAWNKEEAVDSRISFFTTTGNTADYSTGTLDGLDVIQFKNIAIADDSEWRPRYDFNNLEDKGGTTDEATVICWAKVSSGTGKISTNLRQTSPENTIASSGFIVIGTEWTPVYAYGSNPNSYPLGQIQWDISHIENDGKDIYVTFPTVSQNLSDAPIAGMELARVGSTINANRQGAVYIASEDLNSPYTDVIGDVKNVEFFRHQDTTKSRYGNLEGVIDPVFGQLNGYGSYIQNLYASGNVQIAGTLTAGDANGVGNTFYAGRIRKNLTLNSKDANNWSANSWTSTQTFTFPTTDNPFGDNVEVARVTMDTNSTGYMRFIKALSNPNDIPQAELSNDMSFSVYVRSSREMDIQIVTFDSSFGNSNTQTIMTVGSEWVKVSAHDLVFDNLSADGRILLRVSGLNTSDWFEVSDPQLEYGKQVTNYQPTDGTLAASDNGYGMWAIKGGFGGTIQNPKVALAEEGIVVRKDGASSVWLSNDTISIGYSDNEWGIIGKVGVNTIFQLGSANQIAGWGFDNQTISNVTGDGRIYILSDTAGFSGSSKGGASIIADNVEGDVRISMGEVYTQTGNAGNPGFESADGINVWQSGIGDIFSAYKTRGGALRTQIAGWNFTDEYIQKVVGDTFISMSSELNPTVQIFQGFSLYRNDADVADVNNSVKLIRMGLIGNPDSYNSLTNGSYGIQIGVGNTTNFKDIFRVDENGAKIAGFSFDDVVFQSTDNTGFGGVGMYLNPVLNRFSLASTFTVDDGVLTATDAILSGQFGNNDGDYLIDEEGIKIKATSGEPARSRTIKFTDDFSLLAPQGFFEIFADDALANLRATNNIAINAEGSVFIAAEEFQASTIFMDLDSIDLDSDYLNLDADFNINLTASNNVNINAGVISLDGIINLEDSELVNINETRYNYEPVTIGNTTPRQINTDKSLIVLTSTVSGGRIYKIMDGDGTSPQTGKVLTIVNSGSNNVTLRKDVGTSPNLIFANNQNAQNLLRDSCLILVYYFGSWHVQQDYGSN